MNKDTLNKAVEAYIAKGRQAIENFLSEFNQGQRKKILKKERIREHCKNFGVEIEEEYYG